MVNYDVDQPIWEQFVLALKKVLSGGGTQRDLKQAVVVFDGSRMCVTPSELKTLHGKSWDAEKRIVAECETRTGMAYWRMNAFPNATHRFDCSLQNVYDDGIVYLFRAVSRIPVAYGERTSERFHDLFRAFRLLSKSDEWLQAREIARMAVRLNPKTDSMARYALARINDRTNLFDEAVSELSHVVRNGLDCTGFQYPFLRFERAAMRCRAGLPFFHDSFR